MRAQVGFTALLLALALPRAGAAAALDGPAMLYMVEVGPPRAPGTPPYQPRPGPCEWRVVSLVEPVGHPEAGPGRQLGPVLRYLTTPTCPGSDVLFDVRLRRTYFALENRRFFVHDWGTAAPRPLPEQAIGGGIKEWYVAPDTGRLTVRKAYPNPTEPHGYTEGLIVETLTLSADLKRWNSARSSFAWDYTDERPQLPGLATRAGSHPLAELLAESACGRTTCSFQGFAGNVGTRRTVERAMRVGRREAQARQEDGRERVAMIPFGEAALLYGVYFRDMRTGGSPVFWVRKNGQGLAPITVNEFIANFSVTVRGRHALLREQGAGNAPQLFRDDSPRPLLSEPEGHGAVWLPFSGLCSAGCVELPSQSSGSLPSAPSAK